MGVAEKCTNRIQTTLDSLDELLCCQQDLLDSLSKAPGSRDAAYTAATTPPLSETDAIMDELAALLDKPLPSDPKPFISPEKQCEKERKPETNSQQQQVFDFSSYRRQAAPKADIFTPSAHQKPLEHPAADLRSLRETPLSGNGKDDQTESIITENQLRALSRKHLLMMIRDLETELQQVKHEHQNLLLAYQAGLAQKPQVNRVEKYAKQQRQKNT